MREVGGWRAGGLAAAGVVGVAGVTLLLVVLASAAGSVEPVSKSTAVREPGDWRSPTQLSTPSTVPTGWGLGGDGWTAPAWLGAVVEIVFWTVAAVVGFLLLRVILRALLRVVREIELPEAERVDPASWQRVAREEMSEAVAASSSQIETGTPSDAIVACWLALERAAAAAGVARKPSETPSELAVRVLAACWVSRAALERLAELYREARYSEHGLPESARTEAREALALLRDELAPVAEL